MGRRKRPDHVKNNIYNNFGKPLSVDNSASRRDVMITMYTRLLEDMALARFKWRNMPPGIDVRYLEQALIRNGLAAFYFDTDYDRFMCLAASPAGVVNMYNNPTDFQVYGNSMVNKTISGRDCIPIWGNRTRTPELDAIMIFAQRLAEIDVTFDVTALALRHPYIISASQDERVSMMNAFRSVADGDPVIFTTDAMGPAALGERAQVLDMRLEKGTVADIQAAKSRVWDEALTYLGVKNVNDDKRERMVVEEAVGSMGQVAMMRTVSIGPRRDAAREINKKYGLDIIVEWAPQEDEI